MPLKSIYIISTQRGQISRCLSLVKLFQAGLTFRARPGAYPGVDHLTSASLR
jgi:hypothetical protein